MKLSLIGLALVSSLAFALEAKADFGEVDLIVREGVESFFSENNLTVVMSKFSYSSDPKYSARQLIVHSTVWAEQRQIFPYWGWYDCETKLKILEPGHYTDAVTDCSFDPE